ncbi:IS3 family transposase [Cellulomonas telluris]|uniref:IS3 family transposase n=1 Tax=Cellulomonas telluris TaxID=2306636 RepID=UPI0010A94BE3|nr:IS3 family transposase [Cellulomonas telluris]
MNRRAALSFIDAQKTAYGVRRLCRVMQISPSNFYEWAARGGGPSAAEVDEAHRAHAAREAFIEHRSVYGARRLTADLRHRGHTWNHKYVARLMRVTGIEGAHRRRRGKYGRRAVSTATAPDLVARQFTAPEPNRLWVADITYLRTGEGFVYLALVVDAYSRRMVGWAMADHLRTELVLDAVGMAIFTRRPEPGLVHHTDRGSQYTSYEFGKALRSSGLLASMGRAGSAFDNAMAESVFATLKTELVYRRSWPTRHELEMEVSSYPRGLLQHPPPPHPARQPQPRRLREHHPDTKPGVHLTGVTSSDVTTTPAWRPSASSGRSPRASPTAPWEAQPPPRWRRGSPRSPNRRSGTRSNTSRQNHGTPASSARSTRLPATDRCLAHRRTVRGR